MSVIMCVSQASTLGLGAEITQNDEQKNTRSQETLTLEVGMHPTGILSFFSTFELIWEIYPSLWLNNCPASVTGAGRFKALDVDCPVVCNGAELCWLTTVVPLLPNLNIGGAVGATNCNPCEYFKDTAENLWYQFLHIHMYLSQEEMSVNSFQN